MLVRVRVDLQKIHQNSLTNLRRVHRQHPLYYLHLVTCNVFIVFSSEDMSEGTQETLKEFFRNVFLDKISLESVR